MISVLFSIHHLSSRFKFIEQLLVLRSLLLIMIPCFLEYES